MHDLPGVSGNARSLSWRWRIEQGNPAGDPNTRSGDDHPLAVCVMFDLPLSAVPFTERQVLRAARLTSGENLATATLCYTWDERLAPGTVLDSPFTRRVRNMVLRGTGEPLQQWRQEQRDLHADFLKLFGDESSTVPPLAVGDGVGRFGQHARTQPGVVERPGAAVRRALAELVRR